MVYIGITARLLRKRWAEHCYEARGGSLRPLHQAIREFGEHAFLYEEIGVYENYEDLKAAEIALIALHESLMPNGYNATLGGDGQLGHVPSAEVRAVLSAKLTGQKRSPETCARIGASKKGFRHSAESRARISAGTKGLTIGRVVSSETKAKLAAAGQGRVLSAETRRRMSAARTGQKRSPFSVEHCVRISAAKCVPVIVDGIQHESYTACAHALGVSRSEVGRWVASGKAIAFHS